MVEEFLNKLELKFLVEKIWESFISGIFTGMFLYLIISKKKKEKREKTNFIIYPNTYINFEKFTRKMIVDLGRKAIRDPKTNQILVNPSIMPDGISIESENLSSQGYRNLALKKYIDYLKNVHQKK